MSAVDRLLDEARSRIQRWSPTETRELVQRGALLIDIRPVAQRAAHGVVPGALCIERNVLEWRLDPGGDHRILEATSCARRVIILCQQGYASSLAADSLRSLGYTQAADMIDGFDGWRAAGLPIADFSP
jgi:rhodanese-related sulfurtransferase